MADPFSVFTGVVSILDVGVRASTRLGNMVQAWRNAPAEIIALGNEVADLNVVFDKVRSVSQTAKGNAALHNDVEFATPLNDQVEAARRHIDELKAIIDHLEHLKRHKRRLKWLRQTSRAAMLQQELRGIRLRINGLLIAQNLSTSSRIALDIQSVQANLGQNRSELAGRLQSMDEGIRRMATEMATVNTAQRSADNSMQHLVDLVGSIAHTINAEESGTSRAVDSIRTLIDSQTSMVTSRLDSLTLATTRRIETSPAQEPSFAASNMPLHLYGTLQSISVVTKRRRIICSGSCTCICHQRCRSGYHWQLPPWLRGILGSLFIGYTGCPMTTARCDSPACLESAMVRLEVTYMFPAWLLYYFLYMVLQRTATGRPTFGFIIAQSVPFEAGGIHHAALTNNIGMLKIALARNPECVSYSDQHGQQPVMHAIQSGSVEAVQILLHAGGNLDIRDSYGTSAGQMAAAVTIAKVHSQDKLESLARLIPVSRYIEDLELSTLHLVASGYLVGDIASILSREDAHDVDINCVDGFGRTPLYWAVRVGNTPAARELLRHGADISLQPQFGSSLLAASLTMEEGLECFRLLVDHGAKLDVASEHDGWYPIHWACWYDRLEEVKMMVSAGVDVNVQMRAERATSLNVAAQRGHVDILEYLLRIGADASIADDAGYTPLAEATIANTAGCIEVLLRHGASLQPALGRNILYEAAEFANVETFTALTDSLSEVIRQDIDGQMLKERFGKRGDVPQDIAEAFAMLIKEIGSEEIVEREDGVCNEGEIEPDLEYDGEVFFDALE